MAGPPKGRVPPPRAAAEQGDVRAEGALKARYRAAAESYLEARGVDPAQREALLRELFGDAGGASVDTREDGEASGFRERVRRRARLPKLAIGLVALFGLGSLLVLMTPAYMKEHAGSAERRGKLAEYVEEETPEWLDDSKMDDEEGGRGRRHRAEEGVAQGRRDEKKTRNKFGIEGPEGNEDPHMAREQAREQAANAGVIGTLRSSVGAWDSPGQQSPYGADQELGNDPMGALMGDQIGSNFGFGGLGLRGTGRGGGGTSEGTLGLGNIGTMGLQVAPEPAPAAPEAKDDLQPSPAPARRRPARSSGDARRPRIAAKGIAGKGAPNGRALTREMLRASAAQGDAGAPEASAEALLARHTALEGLKFREARGYWQNTYVPGDPVLRTLRARVAERDPSILATLDVRAGEPSDAAMRYQQPFDPPTDAALALYVHGSEAGAVERSRMLVQVGLQATPRLSGRRPAMNVAVVLDLSALGPNPSALTPETRAAMRAVVHAFEKARDLGDRFSLTVAGLPGGLVVPSSEFRHGPLSIALRRLMGEPDAAVGETLDLLQAVKLAGATARASDDPSAPLGSSVVVVVTPSRLGARLSPLSQLAHAGAVDGVPLSVMGVGPGVDASELGSLALAGQGHRRLLARAADATRAVDQELSAVARVVARAVRLRIRLAPGVKLVDVLGSKRLDEARAERVREAEQSVDRRLSRNLGIEADRGEDEEGIQIVIPSFYAGDSHVILLDVVADGPGPIADVTARYKDLVQLRNGVSRASMRLPGRRLARGALQHSVLKNLVAHEVSTQLMAAADHMRGGDRRGAIRVVHGGARLVEGFTRLLPGLGRDRDLSRDLTLLSEYRRLLEHDAALAQRDYLNDSLRLSALLKLRPRPPWEGPTHLRGAP
ncbi:MAG: hypothetical protein OXT09_27950 [Myxococcales bacterium]|nr:hypothetical protein [Myxococcales bacterium]